MFQLQFNIFRDSKKGHRHSKEEMLFPVTRFMAFIFSRRVGHGGGEEARLSLSRGLVEAGKREEKEIDEIGVNFLF